MLKVKPEYLSKRGRREFVVLTVEDFERMKKVCPLRTMRL